LACVAAAAEAAAAAAQAAAAQQQGAAAQQAQAYHVVECFNSDDTTVEALVGVMTEKLGATKEQAAQLVDKIDKKGQAVVVAGPKSSCEDAAKHFTEIGMKAEVRPLKVTDVPSEYDESDVIVAGPTQMNELLTEGNGLLVTFFAPWCGHCKTMAPAYKDAATKLKAESIKVAAVDCQLSPGLCQQLGVRGYPAVKWLQRKDEMIAVADYQGPRDSDSFVRFAQAASKATELKSKLGQGAATPAAAAVAVDGGSKPAAAEGAKEEAATVAAAGSAASKSKLGQSKVGGAASGVGLTKAKMPAEAESEKKPEAATATP